MPRRLLLVDDDQTVLLTLKAVLELNNFEVETACSVQQACARLAASTFQIVLTDVHMESESSGLEVVRVAQQQNYHPAIAVLTAFPPRDEHWPKANCALLVKPISTRELVAELELLLARRQATPPPEL